MPDIIKISEYDADTQNIIIKNIDETIGIANAISQMSVPSSEYGALIDPSKMSSDLVYAITNIRSLILRLFENYATPQAEQIKTELESSMNDLNYILLSYESTISNDSYEKISDISNALSEIRLTFTDLIYPFLQEGLEQSGVEYSSDFDKIVKELDPNIRRFFKQVSVNPPIYEYKDTEIKLKFDKKKRPYFEIPGSGITSRSIKSVVKYIEFAK